LKVALPRLPDRTLLADLCREAAARERVQPQLVEKDWKAAAWRLDAN
jgi:hypothetical protein